MAPFSACNFFNSTQLATPGHVRTVRPNSSETNMHKKPSLQHRICHCHISCMAMAVSGRSSSCSDYNMIGLALGILLGSRLCLCQIWGLGGTSGLSVGHC